MSNAEFVQAKMLVRANKKYTVVAGFSLKAGGRRHLPSPKEFFTGYFSVLT